MADFTFEGTKKKMKVDSATPARIASRFGLKEDTIVVWDEDTGDAHEPQGNGFQPPLIDGHSYEVNGTELAAIAKAERLGWIRDQRDNLINEMISSSDLKASAEMLYHAPQSVVLVETLAILAGSAPDMTLVSSAMSEKKFKRLRTPGSFKASLYQVASSMCDTFRTADYSMGTIKAQLIDLPDYFVETIRAVGDGQDMLTEKILQRTSARIENASKKCLEQSEKAREAFTRLVLDLRELCQAVIAAKKTKEEGLEKLEKELRVKEEMLSKEKQELEQRHEEIKMRAEKAYKEYKDREGSFFRHFFFSQSRSAKSRYDDVSKEEEPLLAKMRKNQEESDKILLKLQGLNFEGISHTDIVTYFYKGLEHLETVQENSNQIISFFSAINIVVQENLKENINTFLQEAKVTEGAVTDLASHRLMLQSALKAVGYCIQVGNCAQIYKLVSEKYVMPKIGGVGKRFALTKEEANAKKAEMDIQTMLNDCKNGVQELIDEQLRLLGERFQKQMEIHAVCFLSEPVRDEPIGHVIDD